MKILILGSGCKNCKKLYQNTVLAVAELGLEVEVIKITDFAKISEYNVMQMPALVFDNKVVSKGKVLSKDEILNMLK
ncbi:thioredoxin family protein [Mycoplasmatota bacterium WC30]